MIARLVAVASPLVPDPDEAREWAERELAKPEYAEAQPTPIDRIAIAVRDFFASLFGNGPAGFDGWFAAAAALVIVALLVAAFLIWGRPRTLHRGRARDADLFGADRGVSAAELRGDADARARAGEWDAAVVLRFRALARDLAERTIVDPAPGATVHGFAREASRAFPDEADALESAATAFDDVRYLRRPGTAELYRRIADLDERLVRARPVVLVDAALGPAGVIPR